MRSSLICFFLCFCLAFALSYDVPVVLHEAVDTGIITSTQMNDLLALFEVHKPVEAKEEKIEVTALPEPPLKPGMMKITKEVTFKTFGHIQNGLTLLNVLYFGGAVVVILSMSLFITVGFNQFGNSGLFVIGFIYNLFFLIIGTFIWYECLDYQIIGGLFATISVCISPLTIYGLLGSLGFLPRGNYQSFHQVIKKEFIYIELGTMLYALVVLFFVPFPFITMPIAFCLWYFSMDISVVFVTGTYTFSHRAFVSIICGTVYLIIAFMIEYVIQPSTDFSFWIYLFGLMTFTFGSAFYFRGYYPSVSSYLYTLSQVVLIILSHPQLLDRYQFAFFGGFGFAASFSQLNDCSLFWLEQYFLLASILLWSVSSVYGSVVSLFSTEAVLFIASLYALGHCQWRYQVFGIISGPFLLRFVHFMVSVGLLFSARLYQLEILFPVLEETLHWSIPCYWITTIFSIISMSSFFTPLAKGPLGLSGVSRIIELLLAFWMILYNSSLFTQELYEVDSLEYIIRGALVATGCIGMIISTIYYSSTNKGRISILRSILQYCIVGTALLYSFESTLLFLGVAWLIGHLVFFKIEYSDWFKVIAGVVLIAVAILIDSKILLTIGGCVVVSYAAYLSHSIFKDSILFPIALSALGLLIIGIGFFYQYFAPRLNARVHMFLMIIVAYWEIVLELVGPFHRFVDATFRWLQVASVYLHEDYSKLAMFVACLTFMVAVSIVLEQWINRRVRAVPCSAACHVNIRSIKIRTDTVTPHHGFSVCISGDKPRSLTVNQAWLHIDSNQDWDKLKSVAPGFIIDMFRSSMHPIKMCPMLLEARTFKDGEPSFRTLVSFGTGENGSPRISHQTLIRTLRSLSHNGINIRISFETSCSLTSTSLFERRASCFGLFGKKVRRGNLLSFHLFPRDIIQSYETHREINGQI